MYLLLFISNLVLMFSTIFKHLDDDHDNDNDNDNDNDDDDDNE